MDASTAEAFAEEWVAAWNARDLDRILAHYAPDIVFRAPDGREASWTGPVLVTGATRIELAEPGTWEVDATGRATFRPGG